MRNLFIAGVWSLYLITHANATPNCAIIDHEESLPGSDLVLDVRSNGNVAGPQRKQWVYQSSRDDSPRTLFYILDGLTTLPNGCHHIYAAIGFMDDESTWMNLFVDWCEGSDFQVFHPDLNGLFLKCSWPL